MWEGELSKGNAGGSLYGGPHVQITVESGVRTKCHKGMQCHYDKMPQGQNPANC